MRYSPTSIPAPSAERAAAERAGASALSEVAAARGIGGATSSLAVLSAAVVTLAVCAAPLVGAIAVAGCATTTAARVEGPAGIRGVQARGAAIYTIPAEGGVLLVDTGADEAALRALIGQREVLAVLVTSGRPERTALASLLPSVPFLVARQDVPAVKNAVGHAAPRIVVPVESGEPQSKGGRVARAIRLPGAGPGATAWLVDGVLFGGEAFERRSDGALALASWFTGSDEEAAHAALARLAFYDFDILLAADGRVDDAKEKVGALAAR